MTTTVALLLVGLSSCGSRLSYQQVLAENARAAGMGSDSAAAGSTSAPSVSDEAAAGVAAGSASEAGAPGSGAATTGRATSSGPTSGLSVDHAPGSVPQGP